MPIALNAQLLSTEQSYRSAGVSHYSHKLLLALGRQRTMGQTPHRFTAFVNAQDVAIEGVEVAQSRWPLQKPWLRIGWEQMVLPYQSNRLDADLIHGLVNVLPLWAQTPTVVTVHDLSFLRIPELFPATRRTYLRQLCQQSAWRADHIVAVSQQTADDLIHFFEIDAAKITVIHHGVDEQFRPKRREEIATFRRRKGLPERFFLHVGTLEPRKNLPFLVQTFAQWKREAGKDADDVKLILLGGKGWYYQAIFQQITELGLQNAVLFPGFVADEELPDWYCAATAFVYPTLFEGFGLPVLEAMACGTPVVCSRAGSLLEIISDAAIAIATDRQEVWVDALQQMVSQPKVASALRQQGLAHAKRFSWTQAAQETLRLYEAVA